ncbi:hypothetical protein Dtox_2475 [Desulfofarcimen acetoxidans DSM 771]|uniref:Uncharacterized protein n=1 Tax=Desulfofarcimen acetoxidans (strain ATCC 49208 / DSM 771 / KCTC 5769 / VKM B-1644 / 5575) TaxID=485916 RepID=C8W0M7_DESAS|nr:hypothetical protein Dtox_2475 [Desulfofarcimen acetoxidans DSM 771]
MITKGGTLKGEWLSIIQYGGVFLISAVGVGCRQLKGRLGR